MQDLGLRVSDSGFRGLGAKGFCHQESEFNALVEEALGKYTIIGYLECQVLL